MIAQNISLPPRGDPISPRPSAIWRKVMRSAWALPVAAVFVPLSILAIVAWLSWRAAWRDAEADMLRAAESVVEYGERTLESYNLAAGRVNERLRGLTDAEIRANERVLNEELRRMSAELTQSELAYVIDREGNALVATNLFPVPREASLATATTSRRSSARSLRRST